MTEDEEYARSELYGLLSMLFYGPPSQVVLDLITDAAIEGEGALASGWRSLQRASGKTDQDKVLQEYRTLFAGDGQPAVALCGSHYLSAAALASLHEDLARLGLERSEHLTEGEDHFAALCDAMRSLHGNLPAQRAFFGAHIQPWGMQLFDAIDAHPGAAYYRAAGSLARHFVQVESQTFARMPA